MNQKDFVKTISPAATKYYKEHGILASITLAQAILESGWGKYIPVDKNTGKQSYNLFGIKGIGLAGSVTCDTKEFVKGKMITIEADFRAYHNWNESIEDHNKLLLISGRYKPVRQASGYREAAVRLQQCGYATDPDYSQKLIRIIEENELHKYDTKPKHWAQADIDQLIKDKIISQPRDPGSMVTWGEFAAVVNRVRIREVK